MAQRGKILRDTSNGAGLLSSGGVQYEFTLQGEWKSDNPPSVGMTVEIEINASGKVISVTQVSESQLAKEQADILLKDTKLKGAELLGSLSDRFGKNVLIAWGMLAIAWLFLSVLNINITAEMKTSLSFWDFLAIANSGTTDLNSLTHGGDKGIWGMMAWLALLSPILPIFWKDARAHLGQTLPLLLMLAVFGSLYLSMKHGLDAAQQAVGAFGGSGSQDIVGQMMKSVLENVHIGMGAYAAFAAALFLAFTGIRKFLVARA
jgi:hypothetical protein